MPEASVKAGIVRGDATRIVKSRESLQRIDAGVEAATVKPVVAGALVGVPPNTPPANVTPGGSGVTGLKK